ncbi:Probable serine/threonine-protein kinase PknB [Mycobacteroides abscessus subsp. abscessus]|uniref:serine/threonine-protein kinase n=1 Tax=Mycobacteroides abscessus TaxID=36809 RepID=UPI0009A89923|nr:serine/threonine-protein kinase [Mycobacteroides abscessus]SKF51073.1 Probable serine/threonine-protein kinase PknB [Mycobacteroides abscessus subsp. abscessus]
MRLGGLTEVADALGVSTQRIGTLRQRPDFPDPVGEIAQGPIWDLDVIAEWNGSGLRQTRAGRPKVDVQVRTLGKRFLLEPDPIDGGGFADVYRAVDRKTTELVAVKVLKDTVAVNPEAIARFRRELRILETLDHPNVITVLGHGQTDDHDIWYAMPLAQGSLTDFITTFADKQKPIVEVMRQVCMGVSHAHDLGVFHRDLKPANVLRLSNGDWAVSDFGLAVEAERGTSPLTSTLRTGLGSWVYAAPEQWNRARSADHRSDIYSLGKILQELVTQEYPVNTEIPAGPLRSVIETATANSPDARYRSVEQFREALERAAQAHEEYSSYESQVQIAERLQGRIRSASVTEADLVEVIEWAGTLDESDSEDMSALMRVLPWCTRSSIKYLWADHRTAFRRLYQRFVDQTRAQAFSFEYCDVLANFGQRAVAETNDSAILRMTVSALAHLGYYHNRWHVRDVLVQILQDVKTAEAAHAAVEALRSAAPEELTWSITDFAVRTLPPAVRAGIEVARANG